MHGVLLRQRRLSRLSGQQAAVITIIITTTTRCWELYSYCSRSIAARMFLIVRQSVDIGPSGGPESAGVMP
jgi:hypothetical protein